MEREEKMFWVIHNNEIRKLNGQACDTSSKTEYWWFQDIGFSCGVGYHAFEKYEDAKEELLGILRDEVEMMEATIMSLEDE